MMFAVVGGKDGRALGAGELDKDTIAKAYGRWAPVYDLVFGAVFDQGRRAAIAAAERIGGGVPGGGGGAGGLLAGFCWQRPAVGVGIFLRKVGRGGGGGGGG